MNPGEPIWRLPSPFGKYELTRRLGAGGMAEVFLARQPGVGGFERLTVIKRILPTLADEEGIVEAFIHEARLMAEIRHKNVVQVYELDQLPNGEYFMAMEYIEGTDLGKLLRIATKSGLRVPPWLSVEIARETLDALGAVHDLHDAAGKRCNIIHRDVSPSNIFISTQGTVKLGDFGVAKDARRGDVTRRGELKGKLSYMAPEMLELRKADHRADLFSMGTVLWECLAQGRLFGGPNASDVDIMRRICSGPRIPPSRFRRDVDPALDACVMRALHPDPAARHQDAAGFQTELIEILESTHGAILPAHISETVQTLFGQRDPSPDQSLEGVTIERNDDGGWEGGWDSLPTAVDAQATATPSSSSGHGYRGPHAFWCLSDDGELGPVHYAECLEAMTRAARADRATMVSVDQNTWLGAEELADLTGQDDVRLREDQQTAEVHGTLLDRSLVAMLASIGLRKISGRMSLAYDQREPMVLHFAGGAISHVSAWAPHLQVPEMLTREGLIEPSEIPALVHEVCSTKTPIEQILGRAGLVDADTLWRRLMMQRLLPLLESEAEYDLFEKAPRKRGAFQMPILGLLPELIRHGMSPAGIKKRLGVRTHWLVRLHRRIGDFLAELAPNEDAVRTIQTIGAARSIKTAIAAHPDDEASILSYGYLMLEGQLLVLDREEDPEFTSS
jgi:serine/threonine-protein kinase